ncbi:ArsR/SmtB family transcription factor [Pseudonocardia sp. HH130629-09]|uniref:ArsR/SmtB family transcription factor n=1 Tax=Pseudonocardia sp. HH130629-09 TaxID=1641402 RepID=UPI0006CB6E21|nr:metalloregulator ArsR/SmtB family transcription factor [Pseudonocardia sp. HH130629-09]ALE84554.1 ArsR family transcriptional regulator [Pseudonocardia sp. HH130629-09]
MSAAAQTTHAPGAGPGADDDHHPAPEPGPTRDPRTLAAAGDLLRALAAPVRIAIVLQLLEHSRCVHDLVDALGVTQPLISQHLRVLKAAGVVESERKGREVLYSLVDDHLAHIVVDAVAHVEEDT